MTHSLSDKLKSIVHLDIISAKGRVFLGVQKIYTSATAPLSLKECDIDCYSSTSEVQHSWKSYFAWVHHRDKILNNHRDDNHRDKMIWQSLGRGNDEVCFKAILKVC